jgi:hypothetical protein
MKPARESNAESYATVRTIYANAAFHAGTERTRTDPLLEFCFGDATAMADAAVDAYKTELIRAMQTAAEVRAMACSGDFARGAAVAYDDAIALLEEAASNLRAADA